MGTAGSELTTHYRFRAPNSGEVLGVHEAARRAGEMLTSRGDVITGALLTGEYSAAVANRDGLEDVAKTLRDILEDKTKHDIGPHVAEYAALVTSAGAMSARLQVYMAAFAPEFARIHPDNVDEAGHVAGEK